MLTKGLHPFLLTVLNNNKPLVMVCTAQQAAQALQNVNSQLPGSGLCTYHIHFYVPSKDPIFHRETRAIVIVTTVPVNFMVCTAVLKKC